MVETWPVKSPRRGKILLLAGIAGIGLLAFCAGGLLVTASPTATPSTTADSPPPPGSTRPVRASTAAAGGTVPHLVGMRLPDARLALAGPGYTRVNVVDATGQGREVLEDNNWVVVTQSPAAGTVAAVSDVITLEVRKPSDGAGGEVVKGVVPAVICMDLQKAQDALRKAGFYRLRSVDGLGQNRFQALDRNWVVIDQSVAAGTSPGALTEIVLTVVKYGEPTGSSGCAS